jgi:hypothetical protein
VDGDLGFFCCRCPWSLPLLLLTCSTSGTYELLGQESPSDSICVAVCDILSLMICVLLAIRFVPNVEPLCFSLFVMREPVGFPD